MESGTAPSARFSGIAFREKSIHLGIYSYANALNARNLNGHPTFRSAMRREMPRNL
jgi:hypothetical protein